MIKYNTIKKTMTNERFAINLLITGTIFSFISVISISICSKISLVYPTIGNLKNLLEYYDFPIKLMAVTLTIFGILTAYHTYHQTKEQFFILNSAFLTTDVISKLIPFQGNINIETLYILIEIKNSGNTPADNFKIHIEAYTDKKTVSIKEPLPQDIPSIILPKESYTYSLNIGDTKLQCEKMKELKQTFFVSVVTEYTTLNNYKYSKIQKYKIEYGALLPSIIYNKMDKIET